MQTRQGANERWLLVAAAVVLGAGQQAHGQQVKPWATLKGHTGLVRSLAFSPDGRMLASASDDGTIRLWEVLTGKGRAAFKGHRGGVCAVAFAQGGGLLASGGRDGVVRLWDAAGRARGPLEARGTEVATNVCVSPDGTLLGMAGGYGEPGAETGRLGLWDVRAGKWHLAPQGYVSFIGAIAFSPDGRALAGGDDAGVVTVWETASGKVRASLRGHGGIVRSVAFLPGGGLLASAGDGSPVLLWDVRTGRQRFSLPGHIGCVSSVAVAGSLLAYAGIDATVRLWDTVTRKQRLVMKVGLAVWSVAFSPDGTLLATGDYGGTIRLWSVSKLLAQKGKK